MAFGWNDFLDLARFLQDGSTTYTPDAALRSATSRAYYAAFCHARNYAQRKLGYARMHNMQDHDGVRDHLRRKGRGAEADSLETLRRLRNQCDYDDVVSNLAFIARTAISSAEEVLHNLI
jgi:hypothetical protein